METTKLNPETLLNMYDEGHLSRVKNEFKSLSEYDQQKVLRAAKESRISNAYRFFSGILNNAMFLVI